MSSITFPYSGPGHDSGSSSAEHKSHHYSAFEGVSVSGTDEFQMNPLSSHPPRTPRTSVAGTHTYSAEIYRAQEQEETVERNWGNDSELEEDSAAKAQAEGKVRKEEIWKEMLSTSYGRDKTFKLMQYSLRMYLLFHTSLLASAAFKNTPRPPWERELVKRFESAIGGFSLSRKCLILFNWLAPLNSILTQHSSVPYASDVSAPAQKSQAKSTPLLYTFLHTSPPVLLEFINGVSDDVYTFSRLGLLGPKTGARAGRFADWCWFASTLVNLVENTVERGVLLNLQHEVESRLYSESLTGVTGKSNPAAQKVDEKELARLRRQDYWIQVTRMKLLMDLVYVSYNVFRLRRAKSSIQTITGLASAALSSAKLYDRHKTSLVKAVNL
ncbi:hypothetical protein BKA93DRAFT_820076 [Sparassis latifolia]